MGWSIGFDSNWNRDIGYGVPCLCDYPKCNEEIDRGLSYVCGGEPYGGENGCGLYFCSEHMKFTEHGIQLCERCLKNKEPFKPKKDIKEWIVWKLKDESWEEFRKENPKFVKKYRKKYKL